MAMCPTVAGVGATMLALSPRQLGTCVILTHACQEGMVLGAHKHTDSRRGPCASPLVELLSKAWSLGPP
jgi:hypothetical protein